MKSLIWTRRQDGFNAPYKVYESVEEAIKDMGQEVTLSHINADCKSDAQGKSSGKAHGEGRKVLSAAMKDPEILALLAKKGVKVSTK